MMLRFSFKHVLLVFICIFAFPFFSTASTESHELIRQGVDQLKERNSQAALKKFQAAEKSDPSDAEACFFVGAVLNRLGHHKKALEKLEKANTLGSQHPDLGFETGWSLLRVARYADAVQILKEYETAHPGRGQTSEFLGRAYFYMGEDEKAEVNLKEAVRRDPSLKLTAALFLASLADKSGRTDLSTECLRYIIHESPRSPVSRALMDQIVWANAKRQKPWHFVLSTSGGYNSNVFALGDSIDLPSDILTKDAVFLRFTLGGSYNWLLSPSDSLLAGYAFLADFYDEISDNNILDHYFYGQYTHSFNEKQAVSFRVSDEYTMLGGDGFRNRVNLQPAFSHRFADWMVGELYYALAVNAYYFSTVDVQDRDGLGHTLGLNGYFKIPRTDFLAKLTYYHLWNLADGGDFDFDSNAIIFGLSHPLMWKITGDFFYTHLFDSYDNNNSFAGGGFAFPRDDDADIFAVQINRPINGWLRTYARYDYSQNDSNIPFYGYGQHVVTGGLVAEF